MMFRVHGIHLIFEEYESFYVNFPDQTFVDYFNVQKMDQLKAIIKEEIEILAMSALDIVEAFDF